MRRTLVNLFLDLQLLVELYMAHFIVWRVLRQRLKAEHAEIRKGLRSERRSECRI